MNKIAKLCSVGLFCLVLFGSTSLASLTKEQSDDVAEFAKAFISEGNERRDENGYPLLVYALSNNWQKCIEIRRSGYNSELYYINNNNYHKKNGKYLDLGYKWTMDCGDFLSYVYHTTFGLDLMNHDNEDPWHIKDMYADANKYANSQYFEFVYKNVPISSLDESKLQKGDLVLYFGPRDNHGLIYVGEGMQTAHASRNGIKYSKNPPILGFEVITLNRFYKTSTIVSIVRVKDGVIPPEAKANTRIVWPDNNEVQVLVIHEEDYAGAEIEATEEEMYNEEKINILLNTTVPEEEILVPQNESMVIYIEKEMYAWMTDGLKRFYSLNKEETENT